MKESKVDFEIKQEDSGNDDVGDVLKAQLEDPKSTLYEGDTTNKVVASKSVVTIPTLAPTAAPTASPTEAPSSAPTSFPTMAPTVNMEESARWVDVINYYRCLHGVPKVEWDNGMATSAQGSPGSAQPSHAPCPVALDYHQCPVVPFPSPLLFPKPLNSCRQPLAASCPYSTLSPEAHFTL